ncbi:MAG: formylglycine-generating enzyme family protein [Acidobacteriota bacterium]
MSDPGRRGVSTKGRKPESERDRTSAGNRRAGSAARAEKGGSGQVRMRREEKTKEPGNAAWQAFGIVSVVLIILGLLASWWVLRAEPAKRTEGEIVAPVETTTLPAVEKKAVPTPPEGMVFVAGGMLRMGRENGDEMERPIREVEVAPFFMDVTEVTNEMYLRYVRATGAAAPAHWPAQGDNRLYPDGEARFPVVNVSWEEAKAFAEWSGKRLPSEVEWEMAARGTEGRLYPWGDSWKDGRSNVGSSRTGRLMRVGSFPTGASPFGILDMCGNAWEWTADKPMRYGETSALIAEGRVIRGGAYDVDASRATTTYRGIVPANKGYDKTGFRCVRDIQ